MNLKLNELMKPSDIPVISPIKPVFDSILVAPIRPAAPNLIKHDVFEQLLAVSIPLIAFLYCGNLILTGCLLVTFPLWYVIFYIIISQKSDKLRYEKSPEYLKYNKSVKTYETACDVFDKESTRRGIIMTAYNAEKAVYDRYITSIEEYDREVAYELVANERINKTIDEYGLKQASIKLRDVLDSWVYKMFLCEAFGPEAVFQYEQSEAAISNANSSRESASSARQTAYNTELTAQEANRAANAAQLGAVVGIVNGFQIRGISNRLDNLNR
jgi:hypothetical protein